jgi:hypothetical protein
VILSPYPPIYVPTGVAKPACCPHRAPFGVAPGGGPDRALDTAGNPSDQGGQCFGCAMNRDLPWKRTRSGWWVMVEDYLPQHLARAESPRAVRAWDIVEGFAADHWWRVPILLQQDREHGLWLSALDRVYTGEGWADPNGWADLIEPLLQIAYETPLHADREQRNRAVTDLAIRLLQVGQWVDADLLGAAEWLSERLLAQIIEAAMGLGAAVDPAAAPAREG